MRSSSLDRSKKHMHNPIGDAHTEIVNAKLVWRLCNLQGAEFGQLAHPPAFGACFFFRGDGFTATYNLETQTLKASAVATNMYFTRVAETLKILGPACS